MYQPCPGAGRMPPSEAARRPAAVRRAVMVMYTGAAVTLIRVIVVLAATASLETGALKASARSAVPVAASPVNAAVAMMIGASVIRGLISVGLWIVLHGRRLAGLVRRGHAAVAGRLARVLRPPPAVIRFIACRKGPTRFIITCEGSST